MIISRIPESLDVVCCPGPAMWISTSRDNPGQSHRENIMKRFALTTVLAGSIFASLLGAAGAAHAEHDYVPDDSGPVARQFVPHVDTSVHTRTITVRH